jgi:hypothetical protein
MDGAGAFERQRERLARITATSPAGVRQHFLRMRPGLTQEKMRVAGFSYDSTWGFSDRNGFRLGVADILPGWNAAVEREQGIEEAPFCWMDRALSKYRGVEDAATWVREGLELAAECRSVEGLWVGVWHPNMHPALGFPGATDAFELLISELAAQHPFFGSLGSLVRWRTVRRSVIASGVKPSGEIDAAAAVPSSFSFQLEDAAGHGRERLKPGSAA